MGVIIRRNTGIVILICQENSQLHIHIFYVVSFQYFPIYVIEELLIDKLGFIIHTSVFINDNADYLWASEMPIETPLKGEGDTSYLYDVLILYAYCFITYIETKSKPDIYNRKKSVENNTNLIRLF